MNDNNFDYEKLENALKLIQNVCKDVVSCEFCPFGNNNGECFITKSNPCGWTFADPIPVIRVLK